jgi:hypothetical protein
MNANELADLMIQFDSGRIYEHSIEIATMLRQQQAEIEALKAELNILKTWCGQTKPYQYQKGMENLA